ncbi:carbohydrate ABC transporter permease [Kineococcus rubinsiae]|uniref:carbohydrate ABC transporter permease n=1 Tax=Kineococcus rubinsiae TaxID=2609562 RepID=UPI0014312F9C|nr:sugar ABC transporter permease [Kineococcus rubinsiae]NIZ90006.1 sugar ABC transporter permease [Kineococcus rubinsiae]
MATVTPARAHGPRPRAPRPRGPRPRRQWKAYLYLAPALAVLGTFLLYPFAQSIWISLFDWNGLSLATWTGLGNYRDMAGDPVVRAAFGHALVLIAFFAVLPVVLALLLTAVMGRAVRMRGLGFFRAVLFLPQVVASVVVATSWLALYAPDGLVNQLLRLVGLEVATRAWLGDFGTALPAVGLVGSWVGIGLCLVLFLSGVAQIDRELYEAARLEGAGLFREFFAVTLPGLRGQIAVALTLTVVAALKTFDLVYVTTSGGPGTSTTVPALLAYDRAFRTGQVGSACAIGVTLAVLILLVTLLVSRVQPAEEDA